MKGLFNVWLSLVVTCLFFLYLEGNANAQSRLAGTSEEKASPPPAAAQMLAGGEECDAADFDGSGRVGVEDLIALILNWHETNSPMDLNGDGLVNN